MTTNREPAPSADPADGTALAPDGTGSAAREAAPAPLDPGGCLTAEGLRLLEAAEPGQAPPELARHLAACPRCQRRALDTLRRGRPVRRRPDVVRTLLVVLAASGLLVLAAWILARFLSGPPSP